MQLKIYFMPVLCLLVSGFRDFKSIGVSKIGSKFEKIPTNCDLTKYLNSLNRIVDYSREYKKDIDVSYYFGLFLANVNLQRALRERYQVLPKNLYTYITEILRKIENLLDFFKYRIENDYYLRNNKCKTILSLFLNTTTWVNNIPNFHSPVKTSTPLFDIDKDTKWIYYIKRVDDRNAWIPTPHQSDLCLASLATAEVIKIESSRKCMVIKPCYDMVKNGTDFGYALAHRLLFLQQARFSRDCSIFSEQEDRQMRQKFCFAAYHEAMYIALHKFEIVDLLLEHVSLCALEGNAQFLRRSWMTKILSFQTLQGCFSQTDNSYETPCSKPTTCEVTKLDDDDVKSCNGHTTAVAASVLAIASRFIIHFYY